MGDLNGLENEVEGGPEGGEYFCNFKFPSSVSECNAMLQEDEYTPIKIW